MTSSIVATNLNNKKTSKSRRVVAFQEPETASPISSASHSGIVDERKIEEETNDEKLSFDLEKGRGGKGTKTISPILDGPVESDTTRPLDSEEIQALAIRPDDLEKVTDPMEEFV